MHALVVSPAPPGQGGLGRAAGQLAAGLRAIGWEVDYCSAPQRPSLPVTVATRRPLRRFPSLVRELGRAETLARVDRTRRYDALVGVPGFLDGLPGPHVLHQATRHPDQVQAAVSAVRREVGGGRGFQTQRERRRHLRELEHADVVRVESAAVGAELADRGVRAERIVHAPPGVDRAAFLPGDKSGELRIAFVGAFALWKGADRVAALARAMPGAVTVVGGPVCPWSRRLLAGAPVRRSADVAATLARAHVLVLPSVSDGFGYVVLEAMAAGVVPVVTPEVGAAEVVAGLDPRLVIPRADFVDGVVGLVQGLPLEELGQRARMITESYDADGAGRRAAALLVERLGAVA